MTRMGDVFSVDLWLGLPDGVASGIRPHEGLWFVKRPVSAFRGHTLIVRGDPVDIEELEVRGLKIGNVHQVLVKGENALNTVPLSRLIAPQSVRGELKLDTCQEDEEMRICLYNTSKKTVYVAVSFSGNMSAVRQSNKVPLQPAEYTTSSMSNFLSGKMKED